MMRPSWLHFYFDTTFRLDAAGPTWSPPVLKEVRLPRWGYSLHDKGAAVFDRAESRSPDGPVEASLRLLPNDGRPPTVSLEIRIKGRWAESDEQRRQTPWMGDVFEEAEALLVLLGCRTPRFQHRQTVRMR